MNLCLGVVAWVPPFNLSVGCEDCSWMVHGPQAKRWQTAGWAKGSCMYSALHPPVS